MDYPNHITNHEKGKYLTYEDYVVIELRLKDGWKPNAIAKKELNCSANTVRNIIKKGMTPLYNGKVFRSITTDNGSEFSRMAELEAGIGTKVYFTHPYTSCEKGSIENHNGLIRRFIPKGKRIADYSEDDILAVELWTNNLPRKIHGYKTPDEVFEAEMNTIYATV